MRFVSPPRRTVPIQPQPVIKPTPIQPSPITPSEPEKPPAYAITPTPSPAIPPAGTAERQLTQEEIYYTEEIKKILPPEQQLARITKIQQTPQGVQIEYLVYASGQKTPETKPIWATQLAYRIAEGPGTYLIEKPSIGYEAPGAVIGGEIPAYVTTGPHEVRVETAKKILETFGMAELAIATPVVGPSILPFVTTKGLVASAVLSVGVSEVTSLVITKKALPIEEIPKQALLGEVFYAGAAGIFKGAELVAPKFAQTLIGRTITGAAIGAGTQAIMTKKAESILLGAGIGAASVLAFQGISRGYGKIRGEAQSWLTTQYLEKGPAEWKGWPERIVMGLTGAKPYLAAGEVSLPEFALEEPMSLKRFEAEWGAMELAEAPRTGGVFIKSLAPTGKGLQTYGLTWGFKGGKLVPTFGPQRKEELIKTKTPALEEFRERKILPFATQTQLTRMGVQPYIPKAATTIISEKRVSQIAITLGVSTLRLPKQLKPKPVSAVTPKVWQPTLAFQREKFRSLIDFAPKLEKKETGIVVAIPAISSILKPMQAQKIVPIQIQKTTQIQKIMQIQKPDFPELKKLEVVTPTFKLPQIRLEFPKERKGKSMFGRWFLKEHPVPTPEAMLRRIRL